MSSSFWSKYGRIMLTFLRRQCWTQLASFVQNFRSSINSLRPRPNRHHVADDILKCIFENENEWISHRISLKFVPKVRINNIPALVQMMAWRRSGDKPLSEPMMASLLTHIWVTRPQWVKHHAALFNFCFQVLFCKEIACWSLQWGIQRITVNWDGATIRRKTMDHLSCIANIMATDDLVMHEASASAALVLT